MKKTVTVTITIRAKKTEIKLQMNYDRNSNDICNLMKKKTNLRRGHYINKLFNFKSDFTVFF